MSEPPRGDLTGWTCAPFTGGGYIHDVYRRGSGPGVVLIPELPGLTPEVLGLGNHLVDNGFTVAAPSLFGVPGRPGGPGAMMAAAARACVSREFAALATNKDRPVANFLRALARDLNARTPGPGVGVIGQCFTGGFALAAAVDDSVLAPVLSQPSAPVALLPAQRRDPGVSEAELRVIEKRVAEDGLCALALRFTADRLVPAERFGVLKARLGDGFEVIEIDSGPGNPGGFGPAAHSVLTLEVREQAGQPAYEARNRVVAFLKERLTGW